MAVVKSEIEIKDATAFLSHLETCMLCTLQLQSSCHHAVANDTQLRINMAHLNFTVHAMS